MTKHPLTKDQVLEKLESIYQSAFEKGNLSIALRAAEMQAKALGMFVKPQRLPDVVRIADMSDEQLSEFITRLEEHNPALKNMEPPPLKTDKKDGENNSSAFKNVELPTPETSGKEGDETIPELKALEAPSIETGSKDGEGHTPELKAPEAPKTETRGTGIIRPGELQMVDGGPSLRAWILAPSREERDVYAYP